MKIDVELNEDDLKEMVFNRLNELMPDVELKLENVVIEVKSKQNYKAEWEHASFRARVSRLT